MYKVFIVDDERVIAEGLEKLIDWNGLECETRSFTCSAEAYGAAIGEIPDIIITDIKMPFMNGLELIKKLKSEGVDSDVIILSGYSEFEYARKGIELGVNTYLLKPVEQKDLESVVREVINRIKKEESEQKQLARMRNFYETGLIKLRDVILQDIVTSEGYSSVEIIDMLDTMELHFTDAPVLCAILETDDNPGTDGSPDTDSDPGCVGNGCKADDLAKIVNEAFRTEGIKHVLFQFTNNQYGIVLNNVSLDNTEQLRNIFLGIRRTLISSYGIKCYIGIGEIKARISDIHESFKQALSALDHKIIKCDSKVIMYGDCSSFDSNGVIIPEEIFYSLAEYANNNDIAGVKETVNKAFDVLLGSGSIQLMELKTQCLNLLLACTKNLSYVQLQLHKALGKDILSLDKLSRFDSPEKLKNWLFNVIKSIIELKKQQEEMWVKDSAIENIKKYIDAHYSENLTLSMISERFFLNPSYISQLFKKRTGHTYISYLTQKRMEKAKELLQNTSLKVYEVSHKVGYSDVKHFSRTFENYFGVKPSHYC